MPVDPTPAAKRAADPSTDGRFHPDVCGALEHALQLERDGRAREAQQACEQALAIRPCQIDLLQLHAALALQNQQSAAALESIRKAVEQAAGDARVHLTLGHILAESDRCGEAEAAFRTAIEQRPELAEARLALGRLMARLGRVAEAVRCLTQAIDLPRSDAQACFALAEVLRNSGQKNEALAWYRRAAKTAGTDFKLLGRLGSEFRQLGELQDAVAALAEAVRINPDYTAALNNLARTLQDLERFAEARELYEQAISKQPDCGDVLINLGTLYQDLDLLPAACQYYRRAVSICPEQVAAWNNLGMALQEQGCFDDALDAYEQGLRIEPRDAALHFNRATLWLQSGNFQAGWPEYEWRWKTDDGPRARSLSISRWDGRPLADRSVLIHAEQGIGDEVMFASCFPDLLAEGGRTVITANPRLAVLLRRSFPAAEIIAVKRGQEDFAALSECADLHLPAGSLPGVYRRSSESFPRRRSYLVADAARVESWRERFAALGPGPKIGISWAGGKKARERRKRSIPLSQWAEAISLRGAHFISLQYGEHAAELAKMAAAGMQVHDWPEADALRDLDGLAAQICALDLVISVGNATVHLAGALGATTWSLMPLNWGWRWPAEGGSSRWYESVEILRPISPNGWGDLMEKVAQRLVREFGLSAT